MSTSLIAESLFGLPVALLLAGFAGSRWIAQRSTVQADTPPQQAAKTPASAAASPARAQRPV